MIEFVKTVRGCNALKAGIHPRTGFMIIFPGFVLICLFILWLISPNLQRAENILLGFASILAINILTVLFLRLEDLGNAVRWDQEAIYVRQTHPDWGRWGNRGFARIPYNRIEAIATHAPPRGVPPLYPVIEIVVREEDRPPETHFNIDPNYFRIAPLLLFLSELRRSAPQVVAGDSGERLDKVVARIHHNKMPWD